MGSEMCIRDRLNANTITLTGSIFVLIEIGEPFVAFIFLSMILIFPLLILMLLLYMLSAIYFSKPLPLLIPAYKVIFLIKEWAMAEVFLISVFISMVKILSIADLKLEIGFWSYVLFAVLLSVAVNSIDKLQSWRTVYRLAQASNKAGA